MTGIIDIQGFERICPLKAADILSPVSEMGTKQHKKEMVKE